MSLLIIHALQISELWKNIWSTMRGKNNFAPWLARFKVGIRCTTYTSHLQSKMDPCNWHTGDFNPEQFIMWDTKTMSSIIEWSRFLSGKSYSDFSMRLIFSIDILGRLSDIFTGDCQTIKRFQEESGSCFCEYTKLQPLLEVVVVVVVFSVLYHLRRMCSTL